MGHTAVSASQASLGPLQIWQHGAKANNCIFVTVILKLCSVFYNCCMWMLRDGMAYSYYVKLSYLTHI